MRESVSGFLHRKNWRGTLTAQGKCQPPKPGKCCRTWDLGDLGRELGRKELSCRIPSTSLGCLTCYVAFFAVRFNPYCFCYPVEAMKPKQVGMGSCHLTFNTLWSSFCRLQQLPEVCAGPKTP